MKKLEGRVIYLGLTVEMMQERVGEVVGEVFKKEGDKRDAFYRVNE